jgi:hypothetical protein
VNVYTVAVAHCWKWLWTWRDVRRRGWALWVSRVARARGMWSVSRCEIGCLSWCLENYLWGSWRRCTRGVKASFCYVGREKR